MANISKKEVLVCYVGSEFWHRIWLVAKFMVTIFQRSLSFCTKLAKNFKNSAMNNVPTSGRTYCTSSSSQLGKK